MRVKEIVKEYLKQHGFDGLYNDQCGCEVDDLAPCSEFGWDCKPGYKTSCIPESCPADGECDFHIGPKEKPNEK